jgi:hypothetical protein
MPLCGIVTEISNKTIEYTTVYSSLNKIVTILDEVKNYLHDSLFIKGSTIKDDIEMLKNFIDKKSITICLNKILTEGIKITDSEYKLKYKFNNKEVSFFLDTDLDIVNDYIFTFDKLIQYCTNFKIITGPLLDTLDSSILLLNNLYKFKSNISVKFPKFIQFDDDNIKDIIKNKDDTILLYNALCFFYFKNMAKYPTLSYQFATNNELLEKLGSINILTLVSKLLLSLEGLLALHNQKDIQYSSNSTKRIIINDDIISKNNLQLNLIDQINSNKLLDLLENIAYTYSVIGKHVLFNPIIENDQRIYERLEKLRTFYDIDKNDHFDSKIGRAHV